LLLVQSYTLDEAPYKLSGAVAKLASINLWKFGSFSYWFDKPWFHTKGRLAAELITPSLGVSNWAVIYKTPTSTLHHQSAVAIKNKDFGTILVFLFIPERGISLHSSSSSTPR
jgi:hypothetical protein